MNSIKQTPQCSGVRTDRALFSNKTSRSSELIRGWRIEGNKGNLPVGAICGIGEGARFAIFSNPLTGELDSPMGYMEVSKVFELTAELDHVPNALQSFSLPDHFWAKETQWLVKTQCAEQSRLEDLVYEAEKGKDFSPVEALQLKRKYGTRNADIKVVFDRYTDSILFDRWDERMEREGLECRLPQIVNIKDARKLHAVLASVTRFNRYLKLGKELPEDQICMELMPLKRTMYGFDQRISPDGKNIIQDGRALMVVNPDTEYGVAIHNNSNSDLYPYLFFFDAGDLSIRKHFHFYGPPNNRLI